MSFVDTGLASDVDLLLSVRSQVAAKFAASVVPRCGLKDQPVWRLCLVAGCAILFASRYFVTGSYLRLAELHDLDL